MSHNQRRTNPRLKGFDYSQTGTYFITVCIQDRLCLLGDIVDGVMHKNAAGQMITTVWNAIPEKYEGVNTDAFVIMPNHIHGIIGLNRKRPENCIRLCNVLQSLKSATTYHYIQGIHAGGWPAFNKRLWQRNYYDHIVRNEYDLSRIREYIQNNPKKWQEDKFYPPQR